MNKLYTKDEKPENKIPKKSLLLGLFFSFCLLPSTVLAAENATDFSVQNEESFQSGLPVRLIDHTFQLRVNEKKSNLNYEIDPRELVSGIALKDKPHIVLQGSLLLKSRNSAKNCFVRLPGRIIQAVNENGDAVELELKGIISGRPLTDVFVNPEFNDKNESIFRIEGYVTEKSLHKALQPGNYNFEEALNLIVEFRDAP